MNTEIVEVKRFHEAYFGAPMLYHTYCSACPNYGTCAEFEPAQLDAQMHRLKHASTVKLWIADE